MGMADEAREKQLEAQRVQDLDAARQAEADRITREWEDAVASCVDEFLRAARELGTKPRRSRPWRKTWLVNVPVGTKNWTSEYDSGPSTQTVAVYSDGTWELVRSYSPGTSGKLVIERQKYPVSVDRNDPPPFENIRRAFVAVL